MNERVKQLTEAASRLAPEDRAALVDGILETFDATDPKLDRLWIDEAKDRLAAFRRGEATSFDADDVLAKYVQRS